MSLSEQSNSIQQSQIPLNQYRSKGFLSPIMECTIESGKTPSLYTEHQSSQKPKQPSHDDKPLTGTGSYNTEQLGRATFQSE